jgi:PmbA protein
MEEELLALAQARGERCEVFCADTNHTVVEFRAGELHSRSSRLCRGYGLRLVRNGRMGFSSTTNPDVAGDVVQAALDTAAFGKSASFDLPGPGVLPAVQTFDNRLVLLSAERLTEWGRELVEAVRARVPDLKLDLSFDKVYREVTVMNSAGLDVCFSRASLGLSVTGLLVLDGLVWVTEFEDLSSGEPFRVGAVADRLERRARQARAKARLASGTYPVIVEPDALISLLIALEVGTNGKNLEKKTSPLMGKEGEKVLDDRITLADNPLRPLGMASSPFDAEGVPCRRNVLFEKGAFKGFLLDLSTAAACGRQTTGSAGRDYTSQPYPNRTNLELEPGLANLEAAVRGTREGLLVHDFIGGGQSNLLAGEVALNVSFGLKIENGSIVGRVKDAMIAGNVYEMFRQVEQVGNAQACLGNYYLPFVKFAGLKVATRS